MPNPRKPKSTMLPDSTKKKLAKFSAQNPDFSNAELALKFNVTERQAEYAIRQFTTGKLQGTTKTRSSSKQLRERAVLISQNADELKLMQDTLNHAIAELSIADVDVLARISALEKIAYLRRAMQQTSIESHIRRADAEIIVQIIRRFIPDCSEETCIKIYREEYEIWKNSR